MTKHIIFLLLLLQAVAGFGQKREFRGAWIQCVNGQFMGLSPEDMRATLTRQLDELQHDGVNAIIFQVRAECDALYASNYEPWSRFLTGQQGKAPSPYWDPLAWMVEQCHKRGMELHAWINPYRAKTKTTAVLAPNNIVLTQPKRAFYYDGQYILDPAQKDNRDYICKVVDDIVSRYDIDGLHIDDYFYPYPVAGEVIPDAQEFSQDPRGMHSLADWRRDNVNLFVKQLGETIHHRKPWVKFGVSPFGIYRNKRTDPLNGSETKGLQNYDDLYADVLLWVNNGWVDYCVPQIYWQIGHPTADYATLIKWWDKHASARPLFIGEDVERTVKYADLQNPACNQMPAKHSLHGQMHHVDGTVLWYAKLVADNYGNYGQVLRHDYWKYPALPPAMPFLDNKAPKKPRGLKDVWTSDGLVLFWKAPKGKAWGDVARRYVVYRFAPGQKTDLDNPANIVAITSDSFLKLPYEHGRTRYTYAVTALDRVGNEGRARKTKVRL